MPTRSPVVTRAASVPRSAIGFLHPSPQTHTTPAVSEPSRTAPCAVGSHCLTAGPPPGAVRQYRLSGGASTPSQHTHDRCSASAAPLPGEPPAAGRTGVHTAERRAQPPPVGRSSCIPLFMQCQWPACKGLCVPRVLCCERLGVRKVLRNVHKSHDDFST